MTNMTEAVSAEIQALPGINRWQALAIIDTAKHKSGVFKNRGA